MALSLERYLEDIETRLHEADELRLQEEWQQWLNHENTGGVFKPTPRRKSPSAIEWPHVNINDALADDDLAILRELEYIHNHLKEGTAFIPRIRVNTGVGNIATAFGAELFVMPYEADTLPNVRALGEEATRGLLKRPLPAPDAGNFATVIRIAERFAKIRAEYPKIARFVRLEQPDLQSPMDNLELLWGSELFYALYDDPETVHALLTLLTDTIEQYMDQWLARFPDMPAQASYFNHIENGRICLRDDSAMNLSPEQYAEFIAPYNGRLLKKYGGIVHFCGRGEHFVGHMAELPGLEGVNMSQPHLNRMDGILAATIDRGIHLSLSKPVEDLGKHCLENLVFLF